MNNISGKAYSMTVFTPIKRWTLWLNKLVIWFASKCIRPHHNSRLKKLSFIHFARWVIIPKHKFPRLSEEQPKERLNHDFLFFESNFNGTWDQYIDAFADVLPRGLNLIWYWSERFPGSRPVAPFKKYIVHNQIWTDYYFNATPGASTNDIKAGIRLRSALKDFYQEAKNLSDAEFKDQYHKLLAKVQNDLGRTGSGPQLSLVEYQPEYK